VSGLEVEIETWLQERTGRECLFTPSGRVALYLALKTHVRPGGRLLMSPITCDVVLFMVLAAGLRPVMGPVSSGSGNLCPEAIPAELWGRADAVLTTNLYGQPDQVPELAERCRELGIPLIEDAAQALESEVGAVPVGSFGTAAAFSLSKHVGAPAGGALVFSDGARRSELVRLLKEVTIARSSARFATDLVRPAVEAGIRELGLVRPARATARAMGWLQRSDADRAPLDEARLGQALARRGGLAGLDSWARWDLPGYRMAVPRALLDGIADRLSRLEADRGRRQVGMRILLELPGVAPGARAAACCGLLAVPFLIEDRDRARAELARRAVPSPYVFDPPLDDYASRLLLEPSPDRGPARWWAQHALPVDPLHAEAARTVLSGWRPASPASAA
jgi:hypothetical protein